MSHKFYIAAILIFVSLQASAREDQEDLSSLVERLQKIQAIAGDFIQFSEDQRGSRSEPSNGSFKAKRPGFFYWHTHSPLEQAIYSDGKTVTVYDPDLEQATIQASDPRSENTPAVLFSGNIDQIGALYEVDTVSDNGTTVEYQLTPIGEETLFETLSIRFNGIQISDMRLKDSLGQKNVVSFVQTEINPPLSEADFVPKLPKGTDIIEDLPMGGLQP